MTTATAERGTSHGVSTEHIKRFEKKVTALRSAFAGLPNDDSTETLLKLIHQPGWTTPAESIFFETMIDSIIAQTHQLGLLHKQLLAGAALVGRG